MTTEVQKALLQWYLEAGADEAVNATPVNRLLAPAAKPAQPAPALPSLSREPTRPIPMPRSAPASESAQSAIAAARAAADQADTLDALRQAVMDFDGCALKKTATNTVFADGDPSSGLMLIGEAPGAEEDKSGIPFCGLSGKLLDQMFTSIGYPRARLYITNTLFWRPPGNRPPTPEELAICEPFLEKHIALVKPARLVLIGATAAKTVLKNSMAITKLRGQDFAYTNKYMDNMTIPIRATFHPSYLMRQPAQKKQAWEDMQALRHLLNKK